MRSRLKHLLRVLGLCVLVLPWACPAAYEPANLGILLLGGTASSASTPTNPTTPAVPTPATPGFTISTAALSITENGVASAYTIRLNSQPTADVMITATAAAPVLVGGGAMVVLTFTSANWETNQTVNVSSTNDAAFTGTRMRNITHAVSSADADYNGLALSLVAITLADDEKRIFVTGALYNGDLDITNDGNPIPEADALCQADGSNPDATSTWKAMIVDGVNRRACTTGDCTAAAENIDWVMNPGSNYFRVDGTTPIWATNSAGIFPYGTMSNPITGGAEQYWTGLATDWRVDGNTCLSFNDSSGGNSGTVGFGNSITSAAIRTSLSTCNLAFRLVCVEQ